MNAKIKARWIKALRSGEYMQGQNYLHQTDSGQKEHRYCCLGVLCELAVKSHIIPPSDILYKGKGIYFYGEVSGSLPSEVESWAEISSFDADILVEMNDEGASFKKIARYIERSKTI